MTPLQDMAYVTHTFTHQSDELPPDRKRLIGVYAAVVQVNLLIHPGSPFTGVFKSGAHGLARLSDWLRFPGLFHPLVSVKLLLDQKPSVNFVMGYDPLQGQDTSHNFFARTFRNIAKPSLGGPVNPGDDHNACFLKTWANLPGDQDDKPATPYNMPVYQHASLNTDGTDVTCVVAPFELIFQPNPAVASDPDDTTDFRVVLARIPAGTRLYRVFARRDALSEEEDIGELVTESEMVASKYGDEGLFIQHPTKRWRA